MTQTVLDFIGEPLVALTLAVLLAMVTFGYAVGLDGQRISSRIGAGVGPIAAVILIVGAGGGFKQTLIGAGVDDSVAKFANGTHLSVLLLGYLLAVALRLATGSATVATITAAGIVAPRAGSLSPTHDALLALAIGAGSLFLSHVNDAARDRIQAAEIGALGVLGCQRGRRICSARPEGGAADRQYRTGLDQKSSKLLTHS